MSLPLSHRLLPVLCSLPCAMVVLACAVSGCTRSAAFWASWADSFTVLCRPGCAVSARFGACSGCPRPVRGRFRAPQWADLPLQAPVLAAVDSEPEVCVAGSALLPGFADFALLDSHLGPFAARVPVLSVLHRPTSPELAIDSARFRVLLLRRLRLPLLCRVIMWVWHPARTSCEPRSRTPPLLWPRHTMMQ